MGQVVPVGNRWAVRQDGVLHRGRFHTPQQAQDWIDQHEDHALAARVLRSLVLRYNDPRRANQPPLWRG